MSVVHDFYYLSYLSIYYFLLSVSVGRLDLWRISYFLWIEIFKNMLCYEEIQKDETITYFVFENHYHGIVLT